MAELLEQIKSLSTEEQWELLENLWTHLNHTDNADLSEDEIRELQRRAEEAISDPQSDISWEEFRNTLMSRK